MKGVVQYHRQLIGVQAIAALDNKVFCGEGWVDTDFTQMAIDKPGNRQLVVNANGTLLELQLPAAAVVNTTSLLDLFAGALTIVG